MHAIITYKNLTSRFIDREVINYKNQELFEESNIDELHKDVRDLLEDSTDYITSKIEFEEYKNLLEDVINQHIEYHNSDKYNDTYLYLDDMTRVDIDNGKAILYTDGPMIEDDKEDIQCTVQKYVNMLSDKMNKDVDDIRLTVAVVTIDILIKDLPMCLIDGSTYEAL